MDDLSLGTGIFWGLIALSFVILIVATKDKWKWGRIFGVIIGLPLLGLIGVISYEYYEDQPKPVYEYMGLELGMPIDDVIFMKGKPLKDYISKKERRVLTFEEDGEKLIVLSKDMSSVSYIIFKGSRYDGALFHIYIGTPVGSLEERLGEPTELQIVDEVERIYYYDQYNIVISAKAGEVVAIGIREVD